MIRRGQGAYVPTKLTVFYGGATPKVAKFSDADDAMTFARVVSSVAGPAEVAISSGILARFEDGQALPPPNPEQFPCA